VRKALGLYRLADYTWLYGQFDSRNSDLTVFYERLGFTVRRAGTLLPVPGLVGGGRLQGDPWDCWFDQLLWTEEVG
jgi:hypothetical protein